MAQFQKRLGGYARPALGETAAALWNDIDADARDRIEAAWRALANDALPPEVWRNIGEAVSRYLAFSESAASGPSLADIARRLEKARALAEALQALFTQGQEAMALDAAFVGRAPDQWGPREMLGPLRNFLWACDAASGYVNAEAAIGGSIRPQDPWQELVRDLRAIAQNSGLRATAAKRDGKRRDPYLSPFVVLVRAVNMALPLDVAHPDRHDDAFADAVAQAIRPRRASATASPTNMKRHSKAPALSNDTLETAAQTIRSIAAGFKKAIPTGD